MSPGICIKVTTNDTAPKDSATVTFRNQRNMQVPGHSIRPGNFHRGRQDVLACQARLAFLGGMIVVFKEGVAVFSALFSSEITGRC
jgi:predicted ATP-dependent Lon-type protease